MPTRSHMCRSPSLVAFEMSHSAKRPTMNDLLIRPNVRISVTEFGPIAEGEVDLRPLSVFVGPSNTGKTYFAILIYALHRVLCGFPRFPTMYEHFLGHPIGRAFGAYTWASADDEVVDRDFRDILRKLEMPQRAFRFSDLPEGARDAVNADLTNPNVLGKALTTELIRCFDLESISDLIRLVRQSDGMNISLALSEEDQGLWDLHVNVSNSDTTIDGRIEDMVILPEGWAGSKPDGSRPYRRLHGLIAEIENHNPVLGGHERWELLDEFFEHLVSTAPYGDYRDYRSRTHYLPAARSGIMQSHRVIASALVARSTRGGMERFPELPTFSGVMADFIQRLILYQEKQLDESLVRNLADYLESEILGGKIRTTRTSTGGYPEFVYRPSDAETDIRLTRASSMVTEVAPVVLFLRGPIGRGDLLIIEEPEAHLHPAAQTEMAVTLARMVRAGVRVVVTTHSDWLLKEIGNLMREGELGERTGECGGDSSPASSLRPSDVGIWLFRKGARAGGSIVEEIPFDRLEGVEPQDYESVAEELYNRSADLQNRFEEAVAATERGLE